MRQPSRLRPSGKLEVLCAGSPDSSHTTNVTPFSKSFVTNSTSNSRLPPAQYRPRSTWHIGAACAPQRCTVSPPLAHSRNFTRRSMYFSFSAAYCGWGGRHTVRKTEAVPSGRESPMASGAEPLVWAASWR
jgi:hypothetical protein